MHVQACKRAYAHIHSHTHTHIHTHTHTHPCTFAKVMATYMRIHKTLVLGIHICKYVHIHKYIHTYRYTHIYIQYLLQMKNFLLQPEHTPLPSSVVVLEFFSVRYGGLLEHILAILLSTQANSNLYSITCTRHYNAHINSIWKPPRVYPCNLIQSTRKFIRYYMHTPIQCTNQFNMEVPSSIPLQSYSIPTQFF